jgi:sugar lactone lactonase YvrE
LEISRIQIRRKQWYFSAEGGFFMKVFQRAGLIYWFLVQLSLGGFAQSGTITTSAGNGASGFGGDGGPATAAQLNSPFGVAIDSVGNLYIADPFTSRIRKVTAAGVINTVAGNGSFGFSGDGGPATSAQLNFPASVAVDSVGNLYFSDSANNRIRKVTPAGTISTVAGNGTAGFSGDGGPATAAQLNSPFGVAIDLVGNLYIADPNNDRIRKVTAAGVINTVAGNGIFGFSGDGGPATSARLGSPPGVAVDSEGNLYIADQFNHCIRKVTPAAVISTVVGNGSAGFSGDGGPATSAKLNAPSGVAVDSAGNLYIADRGNYRVRRVMASGVISTVAGNGTVGYSGDGGPATLAQMGFPTSVAADPANNLYIADQSNHVVRKVTFAIASEVFFPQVAVGGGYSTTFAITNTGATVSSGNLILTDQQGNPLAVRGELTDSSGTTQTASTGSAFALTVPAGGTVFLSTTGLTPGSQIKAGWARLASTGGSLSAVATYEYAVGPVLMTAVGVPQSQPLQYATIPVDNDSTQSKQTAYAIANPGGQSISVKLALVGQDGTVLDDSITVTLGPGQQIARYFWQDLSRMDFKGSVVLRGQAGAVFIAVALSEKQGLLTVIPLIPGKSPGVPN